MKLWWDEYSIYSSLYTKGVHSMHRPFDAFYLKIVYIFPLCLVEQTARKMTIPLASVAVATKTPSVQSATQISSISKSNPVETETYTHNAGAALTKDLTVN